MVKNTMDSTKLSKTINNAKGVEEDRATPRVKQKSMLMCLSFSSIETICLNRRPFDSGVQTCHLWAIGGGGGGRHRICESSVSCHL